MLQQGVDFETVDSEEENEDDDDEEAGCDDDEDESCLSDLDERNSPPAAVGYSGGLQSNKRASRKLANSLKLSVRRHNEHSLHLFVGDSFCEKICGKFNKFRENGNICMCGYPEIEHTTEESSRYRRCRTFGKMRMLNFPKTLLNQGAKFLRLTSKQCDGEPVQLDHLTTLMLNYWKMKEPQIIISFNGGTKRMEPIPEIVNNCIRDGLRNISDHLNTWVITGGVDVGISQLIGQISYEVPMNSKPAASQGRLYFLGIAAWGTIFGREKLLVNRPEGGGHTPANASFNDQQDDFETQVLELEVHSDIKQLAYYTKFSGKMGKGQVQLNPNHSHFLLVDDGQTGEYNTELEFRVRFEEFISNYKRNENNSFVACEKTPTVQILVEGGERSINIVHLALQSNIPVIAMQGTGRFADCFSHLLRSIEQLRGEAGDDLLEGLRANYHLKGCKCEKKSNEANVRMYDEIVRIVLRRRELAVSFDSTNADFTLSDRILQSITKNLSSISMETIIHMALRLDRFYLAKTYLKDELGEKKDKNPIELLKPLMIRALSLNRYKFVELFYEMGVMESDFLNFNALFHLYEKVLFVTRSSSLTLYEDFLAKQINFRLSDSPENLKKNANSLIVEKRRAMSRLSRMIKSWTSNMVPDFYRKPGQGYEESSTILKLRLSSAKSYHQFRQMGFLRASTTTEIQGARQLRIYDLFLWAVIFNCKELADLFWSRGTDQISTACVASVIFRRLAQTALACGEVHISNELSRHSEDYQTKSVDLLNQAYDINKEMTYQLLIRTISQWGGHSCLELAFNFEQRTLFVEAPCQSYLDLLFYGEIPANVKRYKILQNIFFPIWVRHLFMTRFSLLDDISLRMSTARHLTDSPHSNDLQSRVLDSYKTADPDLNDFDTPPDLTKFMGFLTSESRKGKKTMKEKERSYFDCLYLFYSAPVTKFVVHLLSYMSFLVLLVFFTLTKLAPRETSENISAIEIYLMIWCVAFCLEEVWQIFRESGSLWDKVYFWQSDPWNRLDLLLTNLMLISGVCRFTVDSESFHVVRNLYSLLSSAFILRSLQFYLISKQLGPYVIMVYKMVYNVVVFLCLYGVFLVAYGVFTQGVVYHNAEVNLDLFKNLVYLPYWQTYGELSLDAMEGNSTCIEGDSSCRHESVSIFFALAIYMLAINILLINLLIATFGNTFTEVETQSHQYWSYNYYKLISEFYRSSILPCPLNLFELAFLPIIRCSSGLLCSQFNSRFAKSNVFLLKSFERKKDIKLRLHEAKSLRICNFYSSKSQQDDLKAEIKNLREELGELRSLLTKERN